MRSECSGCTHLSCDRPRRRRFKSASHPRTDSVDTVSSSPPPAADKPKSGQWQKLVKGHPGPAFHSLFAVHDLDLDSIVCPAIVSAAAYSRIINALPLEYLRSDWDRRGRW
jgi:hypothetical protein